MKQIFSCTLLIKRRNSILMGMLVLLSPLVLSAQNIDDSAKSIDIFAANQLLSKTINIGFTFDAPTEGAWGKYIKCKRVCID